MNLGQIIKQGKIISFTELKTEFDMNRACFLQYLQFKSILGKHGLLLASDGDTDIKLKEIMKKKGTISNLKIMSVFTYPFIWVKTM